MMGLYFVMAVVTTLTSEDVMKNIEIIGGGTVSHVRNHLALCAPAYGSTARQLFPLVNELKDNDYWTNITLTKMGGGGNGNPETNDDISKLVDQLIANPDTRIIFFNPALVDFSGAITTEGVSGYEWNDSIPTRSGKYEDRLQTSKGQQKMLLTPTDKIISKIRKQRKDIFLVAFKTTCGATEDEQFLRGLHLLKSNSCNLVLANDTGTRTNMIITPEQARYSVTNNRDEVLRSLVEMTLSRASGHFTRSKVVPGEAIPWDMETIPHALKEVVEHCIVKGPISHSMVQPLDTLLSRRVRPISLPPSVRRTSTSYLRLAWFYVMLKVMMRSLPMVLSHLWAVSHKGLFSVSIPKLTA